MACVSRLYNPHGFAADGCTGSFSSSSSSSIGKNSDEFPGGGCCGGGSIDEEEVQSQYKGGSLESLDALEEALPVKRSISEFYCGKSISFTNLSDAAKCSSIEEMAKPENAFTRKRKNLSAYNNLWGKSRNNSFPSHNGGISKRHANFTSMLARATSMNCSESNSGGTSGSNSSSSGCCLPPLPPRARKTVDSGLPSPPPADKFSSGRSLCLSSMQDAAAEAASPSFTINNSDK